MGPLVLVVLGAGASAWGLAQHFSQQVLDQWLFDSAITLAKSVRYVDSQPRVDLPGPAIEMFEVDVADQIYYDIITATGLRIFTNAPLPPSPDLPTESGRAVYFDAQVRGQPVRAITLLVQSAGADDVYVTVAETRRKRDRLAAEVLISTLTLVGALAAAAIALLWAGISRSLGSLAPIVQRVGEGRRGLAALTSDKHVPGEIRPLVDAIDQLLQQVSEEQAVRQRFVADSAHQLRTPLASLRVQLEVAASERDPEQHARALGDAARVLDRTGHLIHQLLTLARADEEADRRSERESIDLDQLARDEVEGWIDRALERDVDLGYDNPGQTVVVSGHPVLLREALANLIQNALDYASAGKRVTVGVAANPPKVFVEDHGQGIAEAEKARVRERFYRPRGTSGEGCGLGLAIVDEIAKSHDATLQLRPGENGTGLHAAIVFGAANLQPTRRA